MALPMVPGGEREGHPRPNGPWCREANVRVIPAPTAEDPDSLHVQRPGRKHDAGQLLEAGAVQKLLVHGRRGAGGRVGGGGRQ